MPWPAMTLLPGLTLRARDDAIDFGDHVAILQIEFRLFQVLLGLRQLRLRLFYFRCFSQQLGVDPVDVALGIALVEIGEHLTGGLCRRNSPRQ